MHTKILFPNYNTIIVFSCKVLKKVVYLHNMSKAKQWIGPVYLEPIEHKYIHRDTGKKYTSVTTTIESIVPEFDEEAIALAITRQLDTLKQERYIGLSQRQILDFWQQLNDEANTYGTRVHDIVERYLLANKWYFPPETPEGEFEQKVIDGFNNLKLEEGHTIWPERILFAEQYELAGMSDVIIDIDEIFFDVLDHKTNKVFNFYNPFGYQTLLKPFDHLQSCQWSIYTLQLSVYARLYEMEFPKRKCRQIIVLYWDKIKQTFEQIHIMYLKKEAKQLIEMHHYNIMKNS